MDNVKVSWTVIERHSRTFSADHWAEVVEEGDITDTLAQFEDDDSFDICLDRTDIEVDGA